MNTCTCKWGLMSWIIILYKDQGIDLLYLLVNIWSKSVGTIYAVTHVGMIQKTLLPLCHQLIDFCNLQMFGGISKIDKIHHIIASTECLSNINELFMTSFYFSCFNTIIFDYFFFGRGGGPVFSRERSAVQRF